MKSIHVCPYCYLEGNTGTKPVLSGDDANRLWVKCDCGHEGPIMDNEEKAVDVWNRVSDIVVAHQTRDYI